ncbi:MAG: T9SS type A sorting domain-containing protein [Bacteroidota bacterium]
MKTIFKSLLLIAILSSTSTDLFASIVTWKGSNSADWNANANWAGGNRPGLNDDVIVNAGSTNEPVLSGNVSIKTLTITGGNINLNSYTLTVTGSSVISGGTISNGTIDDLTINYSSGSMTLGANLNISSSLTFINGIVYSTSSNLLVINDNVIVSGANANSFVDGPIRKIGNDTFSFPTGDNGLYAPIWISAPSSTTDHFTAQYFKSAYSNTTSIASGLNNVSIMEHWILNRTNGTSNVNVKLSFNSATRSGEVNDLSDLRVSRFNGSQWVSHGNGGTTGTTTSGSVITSSAVTSFSPFTLGSNLGLNPLPVSLINFDAKANNTSINITWSTASEENNDFFTVEKSINGIDWTTLKVVKGKGTSQELNNYSASDYSINANKIFYRLKQTNFDGSSVYSSIKIVNTDFNSVKVSVYPNPTKDFVTLNLNSTETEVNATVVLMNMQGQVVYSADNITNSTFSFDISTLESGIYFVEVKQDSGVSKIKIVKE